MPRSVAASDPRPPVSFAAALRAWAYIAAHSFGGPAGQIAVIHRVVVDEKRWLDERQFLHALSYCMLLPGPEAQQLVTYTGWLLHGAGGGLAAGLLFVLPGFVTILSLSVVYAMYQDTGVVAAVFFGIKPAVVAIVAEAVVRLGRRALADAWHLAIAAAAFVAIFFVGVPFPMIVGTAAVAGSLRGWMGANDHPLEDAAERGARPPLRHLVVTCLIWLAVWSVPFVVLLLWPVSPVLRQEAEFFSKVALVTFGGAYSVLSYVSQQAVAVHQWVTPEEMLDGLGLAETTPGPLIMVVQFVAFLGAWRSPGALDPLTAAIAGSVVTVWVTFAPCFLFIFAGAPYIEWLRGRRVVQAPLDGVMAAVVGVILNLAVWFALHVAFGTVTREQYGFLQLWTVDWSSVNWWAIGIALLSSVAVFRLRWPTPAVLLGGAAIGLLIA
jgi:chromate transporter